MSLHSPSAPTASSRVASRLVKIITAARNPVRPAMPSRKGAAASASAGRAGSRYMSRLPALALKNSSTRTNQASGSHTRASRSRQALAQGFSNQGRASENGSQNSSTTWPKYQKGSVWCQGSA